MKTIGQAEIEAQARKRVKVSVIIPAYETAEYIRETLDSVFAQTYKDFEVIVVNDGSPDTEELEQVLVPFRGQILYLKQENRGLAGARNTAISRAQGEFLAFLDSDDCWLPEYLAAQMRFFEETPSTDVLYSDALHFGDSANSGKTYMQTCSSKGPVTLESLIREDCQVIASCTMARRQVVVNAGLFDESFRRCEDFDLWMRILHCGGQITYQRKVLGRYRSRPGRLSRDGAKMSEAMVAVYEKADRTMDLPTKTREILKEQLTKARACFDLESGRQFLTAGDFDRARHSLTKANNFFQRARLKVAILGLQLAPHLTRKAVLTWQKVISSRA
jgi:glycosyltransferase involved in cell wall biosynthesis